MRQQPRLSVAHVPAVVELAGKNSKVTELASFVRAEETEAGFP